MAFLSVLVYKYWSNSINLNVLICSLAQRVGLGKLESISININSNKNMNLEIEFKLGNEKFDLDHNNLRILN